MLINGGGGGGGLDTGGLISGDKKKCFGTTR